MRFTKMHGIGNDYVYVNGFESAIAEPAALARRIADRHFGVGGDGLIVVMPPEAGIEADVRMRMFNADGSEAEMCGNGVRCVCKFAHDRAISRANPMRVQTGRGVLSLSYTLDSDGQVEHVTVDMGPPVLRPADIPMTVPGERAVDIPLPELPANAPLPTQWQRRCGLQGGMTCVSMGNPHAVIFCRDLAAVPLGAVGPLLENHPLFPSRANIHFAQIVTRTELKMRTWERGSGITLACGTGACAVVVAAALTARGDRQALVHLPGGDLQVSWASDNRVHMTGPAVEVFSGDWPDER